MKNYQQQRGFALATTLVMLTVALIALTTMLLVLGRSMRLTRSHSESIKAFYISEAGKSYAMWKLSSHNNGADAEQLAHCLVQDEVCPAGLSQNWSYTLASDPNATFSVTVNAGSSGGSANISSYGTRVEGAQSARRRTKITAFKPTRVLEDNDQVFDYAISADEDFWTILDGNLLVTSEDGEPKAGIHANDDINQLLFSNITVDGPAKAADVVSMPGIFSTNTLEATEYRGASCGFTGCSSTYSETPKYCFGTGCDGYVGQIPMPGFDVNSAQPDSFKTIAREYELQNPGEKHIYNNNEIENELAAARESGVNDGWFTTDGPITYVMGDFDIDYGDKLRVPGVLVVQGKLTVGVPRRFPIWMCIYPTTCQPNTYLEINEQDAVTGLIATNDITFAMYVKDININGLVYTPKDFTMACLFEQQTITGAIVAKNYNNTDALCNPGLSEPMHHQIYDSSKLHILAQGPRAINNVTTVYSGHWEEEY